MVAPVGTHSFSSKQSRDAEEKASRAVRTEIDKRPAFSLVSSMTYGELLGDSPTFAYTHLRRETTLRPDPGFILYEGKIAAIPEVKYQRTSQNAVERCFRWLAVAALPSVALSQDRLFFAFYGDAFRKNAEGHIPGQGGGVIELCTQLPIRLVVNANQDEFLQEFQKLLDDIEAEH